MTRLWIVGLLLVITTAGASFFVYQQFYELLPAQVPTHWDVKGKPDVFTPRESLWPQMLIMPGTMLVLTLLWPLLPWLCPKNYSIDSFRPTADIIFLFALVWLAYIQGLILCMWWIPKFSILHWLILGLFIFFGIAGFMLGGLRRNFFLGIRTPWTLANEVVWNQTHRFASYLWIGLGVVGTLTMVLGAPLWSACLLIPIVGLPILYSLWYYKHLERTGQLESSPPQSHPS